MNKNVCSGENLENENDEMVDDPSEANEDNSGPNLKTGQRTKVANWSDEETRDFISICTENRVLSLMDGKRHKHADIYKSLEPKMKDKRTNKNGFQMRTKLKHLKEAYYKCKRGNSVSGTARGKFAYYDAMDELLGGRPTAGAVENENGIDSSSQDQPLEIRQLTDEEAQALQYNIEDVDIVEVLDVLDMPRFPAASADIVALANPAAQVHPDALVEPAAQNRAADPVVQDRPAALVGPAALVRPAGPANRAAPVRPAAVAVQRANKTGGRLSNAKRMENWSEGFAKKQADSLNDILMTQNRILDESIQKQMAEQRNWEAQMMQQERKHQTRQMGLLMDGFLKGLQAMNNIPTQFPSYPPTFHHYFSTSSVPNQYQSSYPFRVPSPMSTVPLLSPPLSSSSTRPSPTQSPFSVGFPFSPSSSTHSYTPSSSPSPLPSSPAVNFTADPSATQSTFSTNFPYPPSPSAHASQKLSTFGIPSPSVTEQGE